MIHQAAEQTGVSSQTYRQRQIIQTTQFAQIKTNSKTRLTFSADSHPRSRLLGHVSSGQTAAKQRKDTSPLSFSHNTVHTTQFRQCHRTREELKRRRANTWAVDGTKQQHTGWEALGESTAVCCLAQRREMYSGQRNPCSQIFAVYHSSLTIIHI